MSAASAVSYRLSEEQRNYAAVHLNEQDGVREEKVAEVRRWLFSGGGTCNCVVYSTDEFFILRFLRACKFNVDDTKQKMKNYFQQRADMPDWYSNRNPFLPELQEFYNLGIFFPLTTEDRDGCTVIIIRPAIYDPSRLIISDLLKACLIILDIAMRDHVSSTLYGVKAIIDLKGISMGHVIQLTPQVLKELVHAWQGCYPLRIKAFHLINPPTLINIVLNVMKSFMIKKLRDRIHIHSKMEQLLNFIDGDILPSTYNGTGESVETLIEHWKTTCEANADWLAAEEANDALWIEKSKNSCINCKKL